jgi:hypothetical protein
VCTDSETGRDTDNPHLSSLAGRQGLEPCQARFWRPATAPAGCPKLAERTALEADTREGTRRLPTGPRSLAGLRSNMADGGSLEDHAIADTHCFRGRSSTLAGSHRPMFGGCGPSRTDTPSGLTPLSRRASTPHARIQAGAEHCARGRCPFEHDLFSKQSRCPDQFTLRTWCSRGESNPGRSVKSRMLGPSSYESRKLEPDS